MEMSSNVHGTHGAPIECGEHIEYDSMWPPQELFFKEVTVLLLTTSFGSAFQDVVIFRAVRASE